jgi:hypothetical protein
MCMISFLNEVGPGLALRAGADDSAIAQAQRDLAWTFPGDYVAFLRTSNGTLGMLASGDYIDLWAVEDLPRLNCGYQFPEYCPAAVAFGTNGGGEAFVFRRSNGHIAIVPFIGMEIDDAIDIAPAFTDFLRRARPADWS